MTEMNSEPTTNNNGPLLPGDTTLWRDVAEASASREAHEWTWEEIEDVIDVKVTDAEKAAMLGLNGADDLEKEQIEASISALKEELKDKKAEVTSIASRIRDRNRIGAKGVQTQKKRWKIGTCFALNTVRYVDPETGLVVHERPLTRDERQLELAVDDVVSTVKVDATPESESDVDVTDPNAPLDAAKKGEEPTPSDVSLENDPEDDDYDGADDAEENA